MTNLNVRLVKHSNGIYKAQANDNGGNIGKFVVDSREAGEAIALSVLAELINSGELDLKINGHRLTSINDLFSNKELNTYL